MQPTVKAVELFEGAGWSRDHLEGAGYIDSDGNPTSHILEALRAQGWSDSLMEQHGVATGGESQGVTVNPDEEVSRYLALRDEKTGLENETKEKKKAIVEEMTQIEQTLGGVLTQMNQTSMSGELGSFFWTEKSFVSVPDHQAFLEWFCTQLAQSFIDKGFVHADNKDALVAEATNHPVFAFLTKAVSKDTVSEHIKETGEVPPGLKWDRAQEVQVRKSSKK